MKVRYFIILLVGLLMSRGFAQGSADFYFTNLRIVTNTKTAVIIWNVNQPATGIISFGLTNSYGNWIQDTRLQNDHETELAGLKPKTVYHFSIQAKNSAGQVVSSDNYQFTTKDGNDGIPPEITNIQVTFVTANTITMAWDTDEESDTTVFFDTQDGNLRNRRSDGRRVTKHDLTINGLNSATRYFVQVASKDVSGTERKSGSYSVSTNAGLDKNASDLQISYLTPFNRQLSPSSDSVTFNLKTNRPIGGRIRYGERTKNYPKNLELPTPRQTETVFIVRDLKPDTVYYYVLDLVDVLGKRLLSPEYTFRTAPVNILRGPGVVVQPVLPNGLVNPGTYSYGQNRVSDLKVEQTKAVELYWALVARFGSRRVNQISKVNWQTLIKSYVYGQYPIAAIGQAIKWGGFTVHPAIPWSSWKNSQQYKDYINR